MSEEKDQPQAGACVQLVVLLHNDERMVAEIDVDLIPGHTPGSGDFIRATKTNGLIPVNPVIHELDSRRIILCCTYPASEPTYTEEEWFENNPGWRKCEQPFIAERADTDKA